AAALAARLRDHLAEAPAVRARPRGDDLAEERALHALHLAAAVADVAHGGAAARGAAGTAALAAEDGGVDGEVAGDALRALLEGEPHPAQRAGAGLHAAARAAPAPAALAAEEGVHDVAEAEGAERVARGAGPGARAVAQRVAAEVDDPALLGVGEDLVGVAHLAKALLRLRVRVDVRVQLTRQPAVSPLDLFGAGVRRDAECPVVVPYHVRVPHGPSR